MDGAESECGNSFDVGEESAEGRGCPRSWARCFRRVKKITRKTVDMPRMLPITGPAIQTEEREVVVVVAAAEVGKGVDEGMRVLVGVRKIRVWFRLEGAGVAVDDAASALYVPVNAAVLSPSAPLCAVLGLPVAVVAGADVMTIDLLAASPDEAEANHSPITESFEA